MKAATRASILLLVLVTLGLVDHALSAGAARRMFLPFMVNRDEYVDTPTQLRIDNIAISSLDAALLNFGLANATARAQIVAEERTRRGLGLTQFGRRPNPPMEPHGSYPSPEGEPNGITGWVWTNCRLGEGCTVVFQGLGAMISRWFEFSLGHTAWSPPVVCPTGQVCVVAAQIHATNNRPLRSQRIWTDFQGAAQYGIPNVMSKKCWTIT